MVLETTDGPQRQRILQKTRKTNQSSSSAEHVVVNYTTKENPRLNQSRRASGEKKIKEQHGYKDSEKNIEATMRLQSSAQRRAGEKC